MSRFNTLLHGEASEAAAILGGDLDRDIDIVGVRAALTNALNRIDRLERKQAAAEVECFDCGAVSVKENIGTTCRACGRGVIK